MLICAEISGPHTLVLLRMYIRIFDVPCISLMVRISSSLSWVSLSNGRWKELCNGRFYLYTNCRTQFSILRHNDSNLLIPNLLIRDQIIWWYWLTMMLCFMFYNECSIISMLLYLGLKHRSVKATKLCESGQHVSNRFSSLLALTVVLMI